jgi:hypothetical protein
MHAKIKVDASQARYLAMLHPVWCIVLALTLLVPSHKAPKEEIKREYQRTVESNNRNEEETGQLRQYILPNCWPSLADLLGKARESK